MKDHRDFVFWIGRRSKAEDALRAMRRAGYKITLMIYESGYRRLESPDAP